MEHRIYDQSLSGKLKEDESFFAKFGLSEVTKKKLKTELHEDYLRFKLIDEERFKNRFAHKKLDVDTDSRTNTVYPVNEVQAISNAKPRQTKANVLIPETSNTNGDIDQTLLDVEQTIENSSFAVSNNESSSIYEEELIQRLKHIQDAEGRIKKIDNEYNTIKENIVEHEKNVALDMKHISYRPTLVMANLKQPTTKYSQNHRKELENQIRDMVERSITQHDQASAMGKHFGVLKEQVKHNHLSGQTPTLTHSNNTHNEGLEQKDVLIDTSPMPLNDNIKQPNNIFGENETPFMRSVRDADIQMKMKKVQYAQDLRAQIEEARLKREVEKKIEEDYNKKMEERCKGQTPMVAVSSTEVRDVKYTKSEESHARGGHGIFGSPLTAEQKMNLQKYKEDLATQIAEKQRLMEEERRHEMEQERREEERLRNQQLKIQAEYEEEQRCIQVKRDHFERSLIPIKRVDEQGDIELCEKKGSEKQSFSEVSKTSTCKRSKRHSKIQKHSYSDTNNTSELLIDLEHAKVNEPIKIKINQSIKHNGTQTILQQLKSMRNKLEQEKVRVEEVIATRKVKADNETTPVGPSKPLPRVGKRGTELFDIFNRGKPGEIEHTQQSKKSPVNKVDNDWLSESMWDERITQLDQQQQTCLSIQNDYLRQLKFLPVSTSAESEDPNETKLPNPLSPCNEHLKSEISVNVDEIAAKNEQRNRKLETIQLLNKIGRDPELVLESFLTKHDTAFDANVPMM